jgi:hypothetical protein
MLSAREVWPATGLISPDAAPAGVTSGGTIVMRTSSPGGSDGKSVAISLLGVLNSSLRSLGPPIEGADGLLETGTWDPCNPDANPAGAAILVGNAGMNPDILVRGEYATSIETHANPRFA